MPEQARTVLRNVARRAVGAKGVNEFIRLRRLGLRKKFYTCKIALTELRDLLVRLGFARGRVVWVQSSWNEFFNVQATPSEVIAVMRDLLGPEGTLAMPAFPINPDPAKVLEIDIVPSSTGLLTEIFRRTKGATRSIHLTTSVCALGPAAEYLTAEHHLDPFPWGPRTPYCRLRDVDARLVSLGIRPLASMFTTVHVVECLLYHEVSFFRRVFDGTISYRWRRRTGEEGEQEFLRRIGRLNVQKFGRYYPKDRAFRDKISNLDAFAIDAGFAINHALELARRGVNIYVEGSVSPKPVHLPLADAAFADRRHGIRR